jgi:nicotinamidase/pyrazinamidase
MTATERSLPSEHPSYSGSTALVVVDVQNDFADPAGSLYVEGGETIIDLVNRHLAAARKGGATIVLTQDWHPPTSPHFRPSGGIWPVHCVRGTWGAALHPDLSTDADLVLRKGTGGEDGYSAFTVADPETGATSSTGLAAYLGDRGVGEVVVMGLAADVCVAATAIDAAGGGFDTSVVWGATRAVAAEPDQPGRALDQLTLAGVNVIGLDR